MAAVKNITADEWSIHGERGTGYGVSDSGFSANRKPSTVDRTTYPEQNFPEVLMIEAAAQAALVLYHVTKVGDGPRPKYFLGKTKAEYFSPVVVGDQLAITVKANKIAANGAVVEAEIFVGDKLAAKMELVLGVKY